MTSNDISPDQQGGQEPSVDLIRCAFALASHTIGRVTHWMDARRHEGAGRSHMAAAPYIESAEYVPLRVKRAVSPPTAMCRRLLRSE
jgi:hypothetical protein